MEFKNGRNVEEATLEDVFLPQRRVRGDEREMGGASTLRKKRE